MTIQSNLFKKLHYIRHRLREIEEPNKKEKMLFYHKLIKEIEREYKLLPNLYEELLNLKKEMGEQIKEMNEQLNQEVKFE